MIVRDYPENGIKTHRAHFTKKIINPALIIKMLFGCYGIDLVDYMVNTFILGSGTDINDYDAIEDSLTALIVDEHHEGLYTQSSFSFETNDSTTDAVGFGENEDVVDFNASSNMHIYTKDGIVTAAGT
jgi:hypothetical protein